MTDCGGLLVFEELLTAAHLHFNTLLLKLLMQFTAQLCCHLRPAAVQAARGPPALICGIAGKHYSSIRKHWCFPVRQRLLLPPQRLLLSSCKLSHNLEHLVFVPLVVQR